MAKNVRPSRDAGVTKPELSDPVREQLEHDLLVKEREPLLAEQTENLAAKVDRIVVLMMENRSFDHMLGWLPPERGGLTGEEFCPLEAPSHGFRPLSADDGEPGFKPFRTTETRLPISPTHAGGATLRQINGGNMQGFVHEFVCERREEFGLRDRIGGGDARAMPMAFYGPESLATYRHLAASELVCSGYHASIPAGTWPNRMFLYAGTSNGLVGNGNVVRRNDTYDAAMPKKLLTDLFTSVSPPVSWAVYAHDVAWMRVFPGRQKGFGKNTHPIGSFDRHCRDGGSRLPEVVFVDPRFGIDMGPELFGNDDQAPCNLVDGQQLIAEVYRSLAELPDGERERTLLVVTYDEHGGFYDHIPPPGVMGHDIGEDDRLATYGVRVPTFVCSAYAPAGESTDVLLDHASVHATIHRRFLPGVPFLSRRVQVATTLGAVLTRDTPRTPFPTEGLPGRFAIGRQARVEERQERRDDRQERRDDRQERRDDRQVKRQERRQDRREDRREDREERRAERAVPAGEFLEEPRPPTPDDEDGGFRAWIASLPKEELDA
jgi:phospholipase C